MHPNQPLGAACGRVSVGSGVRIQTGDVPRPHAIALRLIFRSCVRLERGCIWVRCRNRVRYDECVMKCVPLLALPSSARGETLRLSNA